MRVMFTENSSRLPVTAAQWGALVEKSPACTIFQTYEWFDSWWHAYGSRHRIFMPALFDGDELVGLAPLVRSRGPLGLRQLEFASSQNADYQAIVVKADSERVVSWEFCKFLQRHRSEWDMVVLRNLPLDSPALAVMRDQLAAAGLRLIELERIVCPTLVMSGREDEISRLLDKYSFRRRIKALERLGPLGFQVLNGSDAIDAALPILFAQHRRRWTATGMASQFDDSATRKFYRHLAHALDRRGWLHFSLLSCGDKVVACHLGFKYRRRLYWYKPSFDPDYSRYSPGLVLLHRLMTDALALGLEELDFTVGEEQFKQRFANSRRTNVNMRIFHSPVLHAAGLAYGHARITARDLYRRARRVGPSMTPRG